MSISEKISQYRTLVFDCDGVVLNSNYVKTQAFYIAARPYGDSFAKALVDYHVSNGGVSRYKKFEYFILTILGRPQVDAVELQALLNSYAENVWQGLLSCDVAEDLFRLRNASNGARWLIVSGGDQDELRRLFAYRDLDSLFDGGIFGSPDTKEKILSREMNRDNIIAPAIFFGDSQYDYESAKKAELDFAFVSGWSESTFHFNGADYFIERLGACVDAK